MVTAFNTYDASLTCAFNMITYHVRIGVCGGVVWGCGVGIMLLRYVYFLI